VTDTLEKLKEKSGDKGGTKAKWKYFEKMTFLDKVLERRKAESNLSNKESKEAETSNESNNGKDNIR